MDTKTSRTSTRLLLAAALAVVAALAAASTAAPGRPASPAAAWPNGGAVVVGYSSPQDLRAALRGSGARIVRRVPQLGIAEIRFGGRAPALASALSSSPGIRFASPLVARRFFVEPALAPAAVPGGAYQWQFAAIRADRVPSWATSAAQTIAVGVLDSGVDLQAPDIAAKRPSTYNSMTRTTDVRDNVGHGTFVSSLAAGSSSNGEGVAGAAGDARLLAVKAGDARGPTDFDAAAAIAYAVDRGAKVINLSFGGPRPSEAERQAIDYAVARDVLVVAAAGNEFARGNPIEYPAAFLQPPGSNGRGGRGLVVAASTMAGTRASFSNTGSWISLAAPGELVFGAVASTSPLQLFPRVRLPGSSSGFYGYSSGTSFAAPQVAGVAALVRGANPLLSAPQAAEILKQTAGGQGAWNPELGFGVIDAAAAVEVARATPAVGLNASKVRTKVHLSWRGDRARSYRLTVRVNGGPERAILDRSTATSHTFRGGGGRRYTFAVESFDAAGAPVARSTPTTVTLGKARSRLSLSVVRQLPGSASVALVAHLQTQAPDVSTNSKLLRLEQQVRGRWRMVGSGRTDAAGRAAWYGTLPAGQYRLRVRFSGSSDLGATTSRPVQFSVL